MQVNDALIDKLARLAMLASDAGEKEESNADLQNMIGIVDQLSDLDTTGVEPLLHMAGSVNVLRDDVPGGMLSQQEALQNAPLHNDQAFLVPKVINKNEG